MSTTTPPCMAQLTVHPTGSKTVVYCCAKQRGHDGEHSCAWAGPWAGGMAWPQVPPGYYSLAARTP